MHLEPHPLLYKAPPTSSTAMMIQMIVYSVSLMLGLDEDAASVDLTSLDSTKRPVSHSEETDGMD